MLNKGRKWLDDLRKKIEELVESLDEALRPEPDLVPVPIRRPEPRPYR